MITDKEKNHHATVIIHRASAESEDEVSTVNMFHLQNHFYKWAFNCVLYSKRIYSANGISRSYFSLHKCFFKTYKNAFKWNVSNWD